MLGLHGDHCDPELQFFRRRDLRLSAVGTGYHSEEGIIRFYNTGDRVRIWGKYGAFWGGLWGLL